DSLIESYLKAVEKISIGNADGIKIVYSPLNGAGYKMVPEILKRRRAKVILVPEQAKPDGNFPTCPYPNPEKSAALELGVELAKKENADLLIATDPDADRVGIAVRHKDDYRLLSGNEVGALLAEYLFSQASRPKKPVIIKTIVTSELGARIAQNYGAEVINVLTGFKYIGSTLEKMYQAGEADRFVLGYEESYGYLAGTHARDKDAVVASMLIAEMCAKYKKQGKTLVDAIDALYAKFGYYQHRLLTYEYPGASGNARMKELIAALRIKLPAKIGGLKVTRVIDYLIQDKLNLPKADVLQFDLEDGAQVIVRPSGTEPLIKVYTTSCCKDPKSNDKISAAIKKDVDQILGN
ncbi:MAG: phospho-sugar mutase, partial [Firmicutes bacterium]|nr:phospho-sugar mutase [Bacillota bacterium]